MITINNDKNYQITTIVYVLQLLGLVTGITFVIALMINYVKRRDVEGTLFASHFTWQINTFWYGLMWWIVGFVTHFILIGWVVWAINYLWLIYRVVKGWINLYESKAMYEDRTPSQPKIIDHEP